MHTMPTKGTAATTHLRKDLSPNDILSIRDRLRYVGHDGDEHVLLLVERPWVETVLDPEKGESPVRHEPFPRFADGV